MSSQIELMSEKYYQPASDLPEEQPAEEQPVSSSPSARLERLVRYISVVACLGIVASGGFLWHKHGEAVVRPASTSYNPLDAVLWLKGSDETAESLRRENEAILEARFREMEAQMQHDLQTGLPKGPTGRSPFHK